MSRILVTGATGFLGGALARRLARSGHHVVGSGRSQVNGEALELDGVHFQPAALEDAEATLELCRNQDWVFHVAALTSAWGSREAFWSANVVGTQHLVSACQAHGIKRLVHISTPSIYFEFKDKHGVREDDVLPENFINHYAGSKYEAEQIVVAAAENGLKAAILRPRAIFGEGDTTLFPRIIRNLTSGRLKIIGDEQNLSDFTYIDNCVDACILAATTELPSWGRAYNITDGQPQSLWGVLRQIADRLDLPFPTRRIGRRTARTVARGLETTNRIFRPHQEPLLTEYAVGILTHTLTMNIERAQSELGYQPKISTEEGLERLLRHVKQSGLS